MPAQPGSRETLWQRSRALAAQILDRPPAERAAIIDQGVGDDEALRAEVERLLALDAAAEGFLDRPALSPRTVAGSHSTPTDPEARATQSILRLPRAGDRIGPYALERVLGVGGMGTVFAARRTKPYDQLVAIKLAPAFGHPEMRDRFDRERSILAQLEHPRIARLLDGGETGGIPYLVMELVEGLPIDRHCDEHDLNLRARIELMLRVSDAVAYAHQRMVLHRDLKPSNIVVRPDGEPKLLDFGIAKLLDNADVDHTRTGDHVFTPSFASLEQLRGDAVGTASDVYGLGAVLYVLLTGRRPRAVTSLAAADVESTFARPPAPLDASMPRDLSAIVHKALARNPEDRYPTVDDWSRDLRAFLDGLPIQARHAGPLERGVKLIRRNGVRAALTLLAVAAVAFSWVEQRRTAARLTVERDAARVERTKAGQTAASFLKLLESADPLENGGRIMDLDQLIERAEAEARSTLASQPELQAEILHSLGDLERGREHVSHALDLLTDALGLYRRHRGWQSAEVAEVLLSLGETYTVSGLFGQARVVLRAADMLAARVELGPEVQVAIKSQLACAEMRLTHFETADALFTEALTIGQALGVTPARLASTMALSAANAYERGQYQTAETRLRDAFALDGTNTASDHDRLLLIDILLHQERWPAAAALIDEVETRFARAYPPADRIFARLGMRRGIMLLGQGETARALQVIEAILPSYTSTPVGQGIGALNWGRALLAAGRLDEAAHQFTFANRAALQWLPPGDPWRAWPLIGLAQVAEQRGNRPVAATMARKALDLRQGKLPANHPLRLESEAMVARLDDPGTHHGFQN